MQCLNSRLLNDPLRNHMEHLMVDASKMESENAQKSCSFQTSGSFWISFGLKFLEAPSSHRTTMCHVCLGQTFTKGDETIHGIEHIEKHIESRGLLGTALLVCIFFASRFARFFKTILQVFLIPKLERLARGGLTCRAPVGGPSVL